ncbi:LPS translocon maturation chaperone LptM [Gilvimarinus algae]|uniref:LPS translocon maturation chaperone LptM n=1 Tax=Gilvimarinus algae TaxID=3058037 RepID=UPI003F8C9F61
MTGIRPSKRPAFARNETDYIYIVSPPRAFASSPGWPQLSSARLNAILRVFLATAISGLMMRFALVCSLTLLCLCTGCGQTGPLYLPPEEPAESGPDSADK